MDSQSDNPIDDISTFIARDPDKTRVIFRRFDELAIKNILQLYTKLTKAESQHEVEGATLGSGVQTTLKEYRM
jgi:hypothetical protein